MWLVGRRVESRGTIVVLLRTAQSKGMSDVVGGKNSVVLRGRWWYCEELCSLRE